jgi:malate synthase
VDVRAGPADLQDRRVEITGPVDRKMIVNALNCGASVFMADFEDANTPRWANNLDGHVNLRDAVRRRIELTHARRQALPLNEKTAVLFVRPRGWHLPEKHVLVDGAPISGGSSTSRSSRSTTRRSSSRAARPVLLPAEAREPPRGAAVERRVRDGEDTLGLARGTIKATVLIETILAAFEMDEILFELREHSAGLNAGRWDYIFSCIKKLRTTATSASRTARS